MLELAEREFEQRRHNRIGKLLKESGLPLEKSLANFDSKRLPAKISRQMKMMLVGDFLNRKENLLIFGNPDTGKSHLLCAIAQELISARGRKIKYTTCPLLMQDLLAAKRDLRLGKEIKKLAKYDGLIIDEMGYVQQSREEREVVFTLLADRLVHDCVILELNIPSYRMEQAKKEKHGSLDATVIDLCASLYDWAKFRRTKGAIKLHLLLDHDGYLPRFAVITDGRTHELNVARKLRWEPGTIVVFDRGYIDYDWFVELTRQGVYWVTRLKDNADYLVVERRPIPAGGKVLADEVVSFYGLPGEGREYFFRRVEIWDADQQRRLVFLSNHLEFGATTLAAVYKERWQVELFFKALKQLCKIKTFVGTSANAVKVQVWTALIAMLLLRFLQLRASFGWALSNLLALLRQQLFVHRDLWAWLDDPFQPPPPPPEEQLELALT